MLTAAPQCLCSAYRARYDVIPVLSHATDSAAGTLSKHYAVAAPFPSTNNNAYYTHDVVPDFILFIHFGCRKFSKTTSRGNFLTPNFAHTKELHLLRRKQLWYGRASIRSWRSKDPAQGNCWLMERHRHVHGGIVRLVLIGFKWVSRYMVHVDIWSDIVQS